MRLIDADKEVWKQIKDYENYQISNFGRVKNKNGKILKPFSKGKYGHSMVGLSKNNIKKNFQIHRLVAIHFLENPDNKPEVCHIDNSLDENGLLDNSVKNLMWGTHIENCSFENTRKRQSENHADVTGKNNPNYGKSLPTKLKEKMMIERGNQVIQVLDKRIVGFYNSLREAGRSTGISWQNIQNVCNKKYTHAGGYEWFYYDYSILSFDIDKVVQELEEIKGYACKDTNCVKCKYTRDCMEGECSEYRAIDKAIEIVKRGGLN